MVGGQYDDNAIGQKARQKNISAFKLDTYITLKKGKGFINAYIYTVFLGISFITVLNTVMAGRILIKSDVDLMSLDNLSDEKRIV
jgi:hypothetical protein